MASDPMDHLDELLGLDDCDFSAEDAPELFFQPVSPSTTDETSSTDGSEFDESVRSTPTPVAPRVSSNRMQVPSLPEAFAARKIDLPVAIKEGSMNTNTGILNPDADGGLANFLQCNTAFKNPPVGVMPMLLQFPFQSLLPPPSTSTAAMPPGSKTLETQLPSAAARAAAASKAEDRKRKQLEAQAERRRKNREASDKSRSRRRALLETLPAQNTELQARVAELERKLAVTTAENQSLRDQCLFLRSLVAGPRANDAAALAAAVPAVAIVGGAAPASAHTNAGDRRAEVSPEVSTTTPSGAVLLAVCCVLTVNQCSVLAGDLSGWGSGWGGGSWHGGLEDEGYGGAPVDTAWHGRGGRVLLSFDEPSTKKSAPELIPWAVTATATLLGLGVLLSTLWRCSTGPATAQMLLMTAGGYFRRPTPLPLW
eukprot:CAMPEP_0172598984 /NCGR_PEP_ID=MMETSP1068-20121228/19092_1 /TAXON_ID=35684 /ORGANISM="Pseudopedinella elastica, Strain CCMP716" /LENGTH=425 /DNA_ID=CAMNT_0013399099 /DNA_START=41 /DNA_END=1315 /DNA_ORIENTATION=+